MPQIASISPERVLTGRALPPRPRDANLACSVIEPDAYVPAGVELQPSDLSRLKTALTTLENAPNRVYYDARADKTEREAYYGGLEQEATDLTSTQLYDRLNKLISDTHTHQLDYNPSVELYPWVDLHPDLKLRSIYSTRPMDPSAIISSDIRFEAAQRQAVATAAAGFGPISVATAASTLALNCEHVVPQSWFDKKQPMRADLHHLFACDPVCNGLRGSVPYAEQNRDVGTTCGALAPDEKSFKPAGGRGTVARATLYFMMRYPGQIGDRGGEYTKDDIATLIKWSKQDPVSEYELHRNAEIARRQGNRNPLIDHPEWVDRIDFARGIGKPR